tara:strand:- start:170 stop:310 length:141 start_codon:yes stop_codon:yes gene_type:complete
VKGAEMKNTFEIHFLDENYLALGRWGKRAHLRKIPWHWGHREKQQI